VAQTDNTTWLAHWYALQCNGDWEHSYGISIETTDNPGWRVLIDLRGTGLENKRFDALNFNGASPDGDPSQRWHVCKVEAMRFEGFGGAADLQVIIGVFRRWAEQLRQST
jgi:hypothetical protein